MIINRTLSTRNDTYIEISVCEPVSHFPYFIYVFKSELMRTKIIRVLLIYRKTNIEKLCSLCGSLCAFIYFHPAFCLRTNKGELLSERNETENHGMERIDQCVFFFGIRRCRYCAFFQDQIFRSIDKSFTLSQKIQMYHKIRRLCYLSSSCKMCWDINVFFLFPEARWIFSADT